MPGIHVYGPGQSDRAGSLQTRPPTLNVPGSYWLSHKQNIYKFTFKYHEPTRDTKEFPYEDELMKVIKRIIKSQPSQGQLNTVHLSITYKHTFWTRQDKMFAMLKFRNREGAAVFPQAFILTISVVNNPGSRINSLIIKEDPNLNCDETSPRPPLLNFSNPADTEAATQSTPRRTRDSLKLIKIFEQSNPHNLTSSTTTATDTIVCQKSFHINDKNGLSNVSKSPEDAVIRLTRNKSRRSQQDTNSIDLNIIKRCNDGLVEGNISENITVDDGQMVSLQDLLTIDNDKDKQGEEGEEIGREQPEPTIQRSSNITNQVMEGLMFTIKQVEDNVKVVEQKTKMELDEVLENSEKVETKEGQRCLVNSSLLRLENLVTKIDIPDKRLKDSKITSTAPVIDSLALLSKYSVLNHNGFSTAGCLATEPEFERQAGIFGPRKNRSPLIGSSESNTDNQINDQILDKFLPTSDLLIPIKLADMELVDGGQNMTEEFHQNLIGRNKRKFDSNEIKAREEEKHISESSSSNADDDDDNNNNNNNNSNSNFSNKEVHVNMWKLLQDITRGAKVMVERISDIDIRNATRSSMISVTAAKGTGRRVLTRRKK